MRKAVGFAFLALVAGTVAFAQQDNEGAAPAEGAPLSSAMPVGDGGADNDLFARDAYALAPIICPFKGKVKYKPGEISCGLLTVPENRTTSASREIELHYIKIAARKPKDWDAKEKGEWSKRNDPIIYLTGGPGAQATGYVKRLKDHGVRDFRDLYILEQRGIGYSQDFCPLYGLFDPSVSNTPDFDEYQRAGLKAAEACFSSAQARGVDLAAYNTIENARDVKALRRALGFEQWNVWGISYGSFLGQQYLKEDPEGIRAAVIDAIAPMEPRARFQGVGRNYQRDLDLLEAACKADETCAAAFPDLIARFKDAIVAVRDGGPIELDAIDSEYFPSGKAYLFHDLIGALPFIQLYEQKNYGSLPALISALTTMVEKKDYSALRALTGDGGGGAGVSVSQGMYNAITCNDNWVSNLREVLEEDRAENPVLSSLQGDPAFGDELAALCKRYGMPGLSPDLYNPAQTSIRTLIVDGEMDPITPPPFAALILPGFSNGTYVEFPFAGHGPTRSVKCAGEFLTKFFDAPDGDLDLSCPESMEAPKFVGKLYETHGLMRLAATVAEDEEKAAAPIIWFAASALLLVLGALIYTVAPMARLINRSQTMPTGGARPLAWLTAVAGAASAIGLGVSTALTFKTSELLFIVGLLPIARWFVVAGLAAGALGALLLVMTIRARRNEPLPVGVLTGLLLTAAAAIALALFYISWGFSPL